MGEKNIIIFMKKCCKFPMCM